MQKTSSNPKRGSSGSGSGSNRNRRTIVVFGIFMVFALGLSSLAPYLQQFTAQRDAANAQGTQQPTPTVVPTFPPPVPAADLAIARNVMDRAGLFTVGVPNQPVWDAVEGLYEEGVGRSRVTLRGPNTVVESYVERNATNGVTDVNSLSALNNEAVLDASWRGYSDSVETARYIEGDRVVIDFDLNFRGQNYVARQVLWTDGEWTYSVRVVAANNATEQLLRTLELVQGSLTPAKPADPNTYGWRANYEQVSGMFIRTPLDWAQTDASAGRPTSYADAAGNVTLRTEVVSETQVADDAAARAFIAARHPNAEVTSVQPVTRDGLSGFSVAYTTRNVDGEAQSGLTVLLNNASNQVLVADALLTGRVDLGAPADSAAQPVAATVQAALNTFTARPGLEQAAEAPFQSSTPANTDPGSQPVPLF